MSREVRLGDDHRDPEDEQQHPGGGHGELGGPVEAEQERDHPDRAGRDQTGAEELDRQPHEPDQEQQVGDVRIDEDLEQLVRRAACRGSRSEARRCAASGPSAP